MAAEARRHGAVVLDFVEEPLDEISLFVKPGIEVRFLSTMIQWSDVGFNALRCQLRANGITVIGSVCKQGGAIAEVLQHVFGGLAVIGLACAQLQCDG